MLAAAFLGGGGLLLGAGLAQKLFSRRTFCAESRTAQKVC
jgi:hypothetical protein